jgi:transcriptional regulator with PAS, ATPase and Fis domain
VETFRDLSAIEELKKELRQQYTFQDIVSKNHTIQEIFQILPDIAESDSTVLIQGPSGSGKELFAKAIHNLSLRKDNPFIKVNCGALPDNLLESELFGYVKGAFTDAKKDKPGRFALADGGTIFLDEIGDMSPALQVKLLRVLQDREYEPLGGTSTVKVDLRVVTATNKDLVTLVQSRQFRDDLYYRLNVMKIDLPPLVRRREDISLLAERFVEKFNLKTGKNLSGVSHEVMSFFMRYDFPGNVRELENIIEHAFVMCKGDVIELRHLPSELIERSKETLLEEKEVDRPLQRAEAESIRKVLERNRGNRLRTARELGMDRTTLWRKIKRYGIVS